MISVTPRTWLIALFVCNLMLQSTAKAAPEWNCVPTGTGEWQCIGDINSPRPMSNPTHSTVSSDRTAEPEPSAAVSPDSSSPEENTSEGRPPEPNNPRTTETEEREGIELTAPADPQAQQTEPPPSAAISQDSSSTEENTLKGRPPETINLKTTENEDHEDVGLTAIGESQTHQAEPPAEALPAAAQTTEDTLDERTRSESHDPPYPEQRSSSQTVAEAQAVIPREQIPPVHDSGSSENLEHTTEKSSSPSEREFASDSPEPIAVPTDTPQLISAQQQREHIETAPMLFGTPREAVDIDRNLDWDQCYPWSTPAPLSFVPENSDRVIIEADGATAIEQEEALQLLGSVRVRQQQRMMEADSALYDRDDETLDAEGNVYFEQPGLRVTSGTAHFDLGEEQGTLREVDYRLVDQGARGSASSAWFESSDLTHFNDISYSTCKPGSNAWSLEADKLDVDKASGEGIARHAKLRVSGVPVAYVPYISFPIDGRRKSGFLFPSFGSSDRSGTDISIPYYFNIAPNLDATFTPRYLSKRGLLLNGEFRYLTEKHGGRVRAEILPDDSEVPDSANSTRGAFSFQAFGRPKDRWTYDIDVNYVSDNQYLDDLGNSLSVTSAKHLERRGDMRYTGNDWHFLARLQHFQTVDIASEAPYRRLPQLLFDLNKRRQAFGLTYHLRSEFVHFTHEDGDRVRGQRFDLQPGVSLPLTRSWGFLTPKISLRYTSYNLENQVPSRDPNPDRLLPTLSVDSGLYFDRYTRLFDNAVTQTLEPRLFYLLTPYEDQDDLPDFDTSNVNLNFSSLFRENRFSGTDRVGDANQATLALTSRTLSEATGEELFRASIGQIYYFRDQRVQLTPTTSTQDESSSPLVADAAARFSRHWSSAASIQWNPHSASDNIEKGTLSVRYRDGNERIFNAGYRYTLGAVDQTDLSARWPITNRISAVGRWTHSLLYHKTVLAFAGFEYDSCCWRVRLLGQQLLTDVSDEPVNSILLQFELKGLGRLGHDVDDYLETNISGYDAD